VAQRIIAMASGEQADMATGDAASEIESTRGMNHTGPDGSLKSTGILQRSHTSLTTSQPPPPGYSRTDSGQKILSSYIALQHGINSIDVQVCLALKRAGLSPDFAPVFRNILPMSMRETALTERLSGQARFDTLMSCLSHILDFVAKHARLLLILNDLHWIVSLFFFFCLSLLRKETNFKFGEKTKT
jgi:hypothetical protein